MGNEYEIDMAIDDIMVYIVSRYVIQVYYPGIYIISNQIQSKFVREFIKIKAFLNKVQL